MPDPDPVRLLSAKQIAPMLGYEPASYKAVYALLKRAGVEPIYLSERRKRWRAQDIEQYLTDVGARSRTRVRQPESTPTRHERFRKAP